MDFVATGATSGTTQGRFDWPAVRLQILANLDIEAEYAMMGVRFTGPKGGNRKGIRECHAVDREDSSPSAFVNVKTGVYHDSGGEGLTLGLWDFSLRHGGHGRWLDVIKHYAARAGVDLGNPKAGKGGKIKEAEYLYRNADGSVRYGVFRYRLPNGKKTFSQHPPDGRGGWEYGGGCMDGVSPVPYRLPQLLDAPDEPVWVVEGEKDADRLASLDLTATTNHQGSGATDLTWPKFLDHFAGRECYVLADNDPPGRKHAHKVAAYLKPVARLVKVVELPGLAPKGDVSDWLDAGHDLDELGRLAAAAPEWTPEQAGPVGPAESDEVRTKGESGRIYPFPLITKGSAIPPQAVDWLWDEYIPRGFLTLFVGQTSVGKTFVALDLIARMSRGSEIPLSKDGECFTLTSTLFLSEDPVKVVLVPRLIVAGADMDMINFMSWQAMAEFTLSDTEMLGDTWEAAGSPGIVVIDPPTNFLGAKDEHKNAEVRGILMHVAGWAERHNVACILITHTNKGSKKDMAALDRIIGSVAWATTSRIAHMFGPHPENDDQYLFAQIKSNVGEKTKGISYEIIRVAADDPLNTLGWKLARVKFVEHYDGNADDMLSGKKKKSRGVCAVEWLAEQFTKQRDWPADDLKQNATEAGISKNALWSPEARALPILKKPRMTADGEKVWYWSAREGWPPEANLGNAS